MIKLRETHIGSSVVVLNNESEVLARGEGLDADNVDFVSTLNLVVILGVDEGQSKHALLLQVGFVNTGKGADNDGSSTKEARLKSSMLTGGTFTVVVVTYNNPLDASRAVGSSNLWDTTPGSIELVLDLVGFTVLSVNGTDQAVLCEIRK